MNVETVFDDARGVNGGSVFLKTRMRKSSVLIKHEIVFDRSRHINGFAVNLGWQKFDAARGGNRVFGQAFFNCAKTVMSPISPFARKTILSLTVP